MKLYCVRASFAGLPSYLFRLRGSSAYLLVKSCLLFSLYVWVAATTAATFLAALQFMATGTFPQTPLTTHQVQTEN